LQILDALFDQMMVELDTAEVGRRSQATFDGKDDSPTRLPKELAELDQRREQIRKALEKAKADDEARRTQGVDPGKNPAQVPTTDPDSRVMPNKEGGYAPNYTPTATTDGHRGFIVDADVLGNVNEGDVAAVSVDRIEETFGQKPDKFLTDAGNNSGQIMDEMERRGVEFYAPVESSQPQDGNPAKRNDPTQPVPESAWPQLPRNSQKQLDKSCFVYDAGEDRYYCPQGHAMRFDTTKPTKRRGVRLQRRVYRCEACDGCPLAGVCRSPKSKRGRSITRDEYEEVRERTAMRMASESGRELYNQRPRIAETPFGIVKSLLGVRQFLLRGLEKVKTEWLWAATGFNLAKLVREIARLRAEFSKLSAAGEG
jgi:hypothetical protein